MNDPMTVAVVSRGTAMTTTSAATERRASRRTPISLSRRATTARAPTLEVVAQRCETTVPPAADLGHPLHRVTEGLGREPVTQFAAGALAGDEPGLVERAEVLGDGLPRHRQPPRELGRGRGAVIR